MHGYNEWESVKIMCKCGFLYVVCHHHELRLVYEKDHIRKSCGKEAGNK